MKANLLERITDLAIAGRRCSGIRPPGRNSITSTMMAP